MPSPMAPTHEQPSLSTIHNAMSQAAPHLPPAYSPCTITTMQSYLIEHPQNPASLPLFPLVFYVF